MGPSWWYEGSIMHNLDDGRNLHHCYHEGSAWSCQHEGSSKQVIKQTSKKVWKFSSLAIMWAPSLWHEDFVIWSPHNGRNPHHLPHEGSTWWNTHAGMRAPSMMLGILWSDDNHWYCLLQSMTTPSPCIWTWVWQLCYVMNIKSLLFSYD